MLSTPKVPRKRRLSSHNRIKRLPKGTVSFYECNGGYYGFVVLDAVYEGRLIAVTERLFTAPQSIEEILNSAVYTVIWLLLRNSPKGNHDIGIIESKGSYNGRAGLFLCKPISFGINFSFSLDECHKRGLLCFSNKKVKDMLDESNVPVKFFCEETAKEEVRMVTELMSNPASEFATNMIRKAIYSEDFFH